MGRKNNNPRPHDARRVLEVDVKHVRRGVSSGIRPIPALGRDAQPYPKLIKIDFSVKTIALSYIHRDEAAAVDGPGGVWMERSCKWMAGRRGYKQR